MAMNLETRWPGVHDDWHLVEDLDPAVRDALTDIFEARTIIEVVTFWLAPDTEIQYRRAPSQDRESYA